MTEVRLNKPVFTKVKNLEKQRNGYNVIVKVVKAERKDVQTKDGRKIPMVQALVADQTGSSNAFFKGDDASKITQGIVVAIRNGVKRFIKGHISLQIDAWGRVTVQKDNIKPSQQYNISDKEITFDRNQNRDGYRRFRGNNRRGGNFRNNNNRYQGNRNNNFNRSNNNREGGNYRQQQRSNSQGAGYRNDKSDRNDRYDRNDRNDRNNRGDRRPQRERDNDFDRRPRENNRGYQDKPRYRQQNNQRSKFLRINQIGPGEENFSLIAKVISAESVKGRRQMVRCVLGDSTGTVNAFLPQSNHLNKGNSVCIFDCQAKIVRQHIELQTRGENKIQKSKKEVNEVDSSKNISDKSWVPVD